MTGGFGYAGSSDFGAAVLRGLLECGTPIGLVLSQPDRPAGRRRRLTPPPVAALAAEAGLPLLQPERAGDALGAVRSAGLAAIAICAYGQLIRPPLLTELPWLNLHPSPLPRWRGAAPIERALLAGDRETAVSIMRLAEGLDEGPVVRAAPIAIGDDDDAGAIMERAVALGVPLLADALEAARAGTLTAEPQSTSGVTYAEKLTAEDRLLDPRAPAAGELRRIRALSPHIGAVLDLGGSRCKIWRAAPAPDRLAAGAVRGADGRIVVGFADGALELLLVQAPGKRALVPSELLRGWRAPLEPAAKAS